jgi:hypothetical protein
MTDADLLTRLQAVENAASEVTRGHLLHALITELGGLNAQNMHQWIE